MGRPAADRRFDAIVFDFSGVMVSSAFDAIGAAAADHDMDEDDFIEYLLGPYAEDTDHAWHKAERGEIGIMDWVTDTMSRAEADGLGLDLGFMASMLGELEVYDVMVDAARSLRADGYKTALLGKSHLQNMTGNPAILKAPEAPEDYLPPPPAFLPTPPASTPPTAH